MTKESDLLEEEIAAIERELDDNVQKRKKEKLGNGYRKYYSGLVSRLERLKVKYEEALKKGL